MLAAASASSRVGPAIAGPPVVVRSPARAARVPTARSCLARAATDVRSTAAVLGCRRGRLRSRVTSRSSSAATPESGLRAIIAVHSTALGPALGGTRFYPYAERGGARSPTSCALARGDDVQEQPGRARPRRRQGRDHRRPAHRQDRGAAARLRPVRRVARRPVPDRLRRRHLQRRPRRRRPRDPLRARPVRGLRRLRRLLGAHRVRRLPGHARGRAALLGLAVALAGRTVAVAGVGKVGSLAGRAPGRGRRRRRWSPTSTRPPSSGCRPATPQVKAVADTATLVRTAARRLRAVRARRGAGRARPSPRCRPAIVCGGRQQPAGHSRDRRAADRARDPLRPRLPGQRRWRDPGRGRAARLLVRARAGSRPPASSTSPCGCSRRPTGPASRPPTAADRLAEERVRSVGRLATIRLPR